MRQFWMVIFNKGRRLNSLKTGGMLLLSCFLVPLYQCSNPHSKAGITVATAANMQYAMEEIEAAYEKDTKEDIEIILSSSGKLTAQIMAGAPYDIFVSADTKYPALLAEKGFSAEGPVVYASGKLVLWSMSLPNIELKDLESEKIKKLAIPNPKTAPYGEAAIEFLKNEGLLDAVTDKIVMGESVSQTNQFITTGAAQAGFTAYSVVLSPDWLGKGSFILIDTNLYKPIDQSMVMLQPKAKSQKPKTLHTKSFFKFMQSEKAKSILHKYGYSIYE